MSQVICSIADRTILVLDAVDTQTTTAVEARDVLERVHARVLGVVLTRVSKRGMARANASRHRNDGDGTAMRSPRERARSGR